MSEDVLVKEAAAEAGRLLSEAIEKISAQAGSREEGPRLFFPNGIEVIELHFKAGAIDILFKLAGEKAPHGATALVAAVNEALHAKGNGGWVSSG